MRYVSLIIKFLLTCAKQKWVLRNALLSNTFLCVLAQMSGSRVRFQMPDVLSSAQLKNLELKSLTSPQRVSPNGPQTSKTDGVLFYLDLTGRISVATTQVSDPIPILKAAV